MIITIPILIPQASLVAQTVKNLPAMQEIQVQSLGQEDPLEKEMATHSGLLAWEVPWSEEPGGLQSPGSQNQTGLEQLSRRAHIIPSPWISRVRCRDVK